MKKKGQFYLLSAIVIISIIIGFSAVSTYTRTTDTTRVFDLGDELKIESANVLDYGTYNADEVDDLDTFLKDFVDEYAGYVGEGTDISFVFGNAEDESATVVNYEEVELGEINYGGQSITSSSRVSSDDTAAIQEEEGTKVVSIIFKNIDYKIKLKPGENFYFVISQDIGEETVTTKSDEIE